MTRKKIIAGNWKMNATLAEAVRLTQEIVSAVATETEVEVVLCPPFTALAKTAELLKGTAVGLGAQDVHWEPSGAFTGEISPGMLKDLGCQFCIIGHSERRKLFMETDAGVHQKLQALLSHGIKPILCVGETLTQRKSGTTLTIVEGQLKAALEGISHPNLADQMVIAYEPVWAIGTGVNATPTQAQEVHQAIRAWLHGRFGETAARQIRIQYGGSVKPENAGEILMQPDVDGALVGGASLQSKGFLSIIQAAHSSRSTPCCTG